MTTSAYIHIPFCLQKCRYCSFVSYEKTTGAQKKNYVDTLLEEIDYFYKDEPLKTLYFGGGTPSLLEIPDIERILDSFNFEQGAEVTLEVNPETVDTEYLTALHKTRVNRLSIGIQSFDDAILKRIGRAHDAKKAAQTVIAAQKAGFTNISADFIYGLPNQSCSDFIKDLKTAVELGVSHISLYGLKIEEGCKFFNSPPQKCELPDDDAQADMYLAAIEFLEAQGFSHYEISNFARKSKTSIPLQGFESRHNLNYWNQCEYYGFGAAAHGFIGGVRYSNFSALEDYAKNYSQKEYLESLSKKERREESIFLGFRRGSGVCTKEINEKFAIDFEELYAPVIKKYLESGHLLKTENGYRLSRDGFLLSNIILAEFI